MQHRNVFNITAVTPDYSNKQIVIKTNFKVDPDTVKKKNVKVIAASSGITVTYKLTVENDKIILKKYEPACIFCGNADNVIMYGGKLICRDCVEAIKRDVK